MFGTDLLEVLIGLFLTYFLFSLLCSGVNEVVLGHLLHLRAKVLARGVSRLLGDASVAKKLFEHPLIKGLTQRDGEKPSYIPAHTFVTALMAVADEKAHAAQPDAPKTSLPPVSSNLAELRAVVTELGTGTTARVVLRLIADTADLAEARQRLEQWFNDGMDRASGWYKRTSQWWLVVWAAVFAGAFNIDTIGIAQRLANDSELRAVLVASAQETIKASSASTNGVRSAEATVEEITERIRELHLPLGWREAPDDWFVKICGLLLSVGAISLGAPFWFDLLNKAVNLRAGGKPPATPSARTTKTTTTVSEDKK